MTTQYWKYVTDSGYVRTVFRETTEPYTFERFSKVWLPAFEYYERVMTEPNFELIPETEAMELIAPYMSD